MYAHLLILSFLFFFFFFNDTATTEIYTLSLHDALPILPSWREFELFVLTTTTTFKPLPPAKRPAALTAKTTPPTARRIQDRKSTRLNSSHSQISYAVFCLKKKKKKKKTKTNHKKTHMYK